jgi:glyceraldehyde 3-phosphate dehydrogenase
MRIAINGMGRMGRLFLRESWSRGFDVVAVNEPHGDAEGLALGVEFDSAHGRFREHVKAGQDCLVIGEKRIALTQTASLRELPWQDHDVDLVVECSGRSKTAGPLQQHLDRGASCVLVSNTVAEVPNIVYGVNHHDCQFADHPIVTAASCTTNCLAPVVRVLHDAIGIERGVVTTMHGPTNTQVVMDKPHKDPRRARSALTNLIPTSTNSAAAVTMIVPELAGRLDSIAVRVPVVNASLVDCSLQMQSDTSIDAIHSALRSAANGSMSGILGFETKPLVSSDFVNDPRSGIVDASCTTVVDRRMAKVMAWYDNEWGYVNRMADLVSCIQQARA